MIVRKILLAAGVAALMSTPAWATPGRAPGFTPAGANHDGGAQHGGGKPSGQQGKGHPHRCVPHRVAYVASGLLVSQTLTLDGDTSSPPPTDTTAAVHPSAGDTYSGTLIVDIKHTNHHAAGDKGKTVTYTVSDVRVRFGLPDANGDGAVGLDDVQPGARVKLIGAITKVAPRCDHSTFTPETTIRQIVFHAPPAATP
jgi:hypothetical protein